MANISQKEINDIRNAASIVDVISSYMPLTQKGKNYFGVCPFHEDHSPSMSVSAEKQIYKCFSCGATGNVFTFVENYLNISFAEAVALIANKVGMSISSPIKAKHEEKYQQEYEIMDFTTKFYQNNLNSYAGKDALSYLKERGLDEQVQKDFDIGVSLNQNVLGSLLTKKGYSEKILSDLGLISISEGNLYDVFRNRIMFPIHDLDGHVVGFTARCYLDDTIKPKYLNSKETYIFRKGNILYNYHRAKDFIRLKREVVVVEGNMDAIRLDAGGIKNVVALMGTSLTKDQIKSFKKLRARIILILDNDEAGETATYLNGNSFEEQGIDVNVVRLSGAKDPDEYVLKYGVEAIAENIENAISFMDFKLNYLKKNKNLESSVDLAEYIKAVVQSLKNNDDEILKEVTLQKLSNEYNISYAVLKEELKINEKSIKKELSQEDLPKSIPKNGYQKIIDEILYCMMNDPIYIKMYQTQLGMFQEKENRTIANEILYYYETNNTIRLADFITYAETTPLKKEIMDIIENGEIDKVSEQEMMELLTRLKKKIKEKEIKRLKEVIKTEFDIHKKIEITEKIAELKKGSVEDESY